MSNETIKLEADCAVATYNHHHHHHHRSPHHQVHHVLTSSHTVATPPLVSQAVIKSGPDVRESPCDRIIDRSLEDDEEQENKYYKNEFNSSSSFDRMPCNRPLMHSPPLSEDIKLSEAQHPTQIDHIYHHQSLNHPIATPDGDKFTQLESVTPQRIVHIDAIQTSQYQATPSSFSSSSDSSESSEDDEVDSQESDESADEDEQAVGENDDHEYEDDDDDGDDEEEEDEEEDDDDDDDDDDDEDDGEEDTSQDQECDDIVDPVGHHNNNHYVHQQGNNFRNGMVVTNEIYQSTVSGHNGTNSNDDEDDDDDVSFENESDDPPAQDLSPSDLSLNSERMLEVTRKLVRSTERDPDRDLRKQVLLRTAIRRLPHFMDSSCNHYPDTFDQNFRLHSGNVSDNSNTTLDCLSPSQYYENQNVYNLESTQPKTYYHSVQPNAIQMSTTGLRMLDLNDDQDSDIVVTTHTQESLDQSPALATAKHPNQHLVSYESLELEPNVTETSNSLDQQQHEYTDSSTYNSYSHHHQNHHLHQRPHENQINHVEELDSMDEQRTVMHDLDHEVVDCHQHEQNLAEEHDEAIGSSRLLETSNVDDCTSDSPQNKFLDEIIISHRWNDEEDQASDCSNNLSNSSQSSTSSSDSSANSLMQSNDSAGDSNGTSILETSLNSTSIYHYKSHDSGVALFSPRSNKRTSSSIGLDDEMEIDRFSSEDLLHRTSSDQVFTSSANHCKRLRKRELID